MPLNNSNNLKLIEGNEEIADGVKLIETGGHTIGHQVAIFGSEDQKFIHIGDLVPTSSHLPLPYIMAYDTHPMTTLEMRKELYEKIVEKEMKVIFPHDIEHRVVEPSEISSVMK